MATSTRTLADMSKDTDPSLYESNYERVPGDRYWTEGWVTSALLRTVDVNPNDGLVWEPACGRGDMVDTLRAYGHDVFASDVDMSEYTGEDPCDQVDFLKSDPVSKPPPGCRVIVTNPPYNKAEAFIRRSLEYMPLGIDFVAMILRSEFKHAARRQDLFTGDHFAGEVALTARPRWDWWFRDQPEASPRHNFSWFVWQYAEFGRSGDPFIRFAGKHPEEKK